MRKILYTALAGLALMGCEADPGTTLQQQLQNDTSTTSQAAVFNPDASAIPFPNNLLFKDTTDGTLNIPVEDESDPSAGPLLAMNTLDGFSMVAPITTSFAAPIDANTIPGNVRLFKVIIDDFNADADLVASSPTPTFAVVAPLEELTFGVDFVATVSDETTLAILPLKPLDAGTGYMVVITNGLDDTSGNSFRPDTAYALAKETDSFIVNGESRLPAFPTLEDVSDLEGLRQLTNAAEAVAVAATAGGTSPIAAADIILSWSFTTQNTGQVLAIEQGDISSNPALAAFSPLDATVKAGLEASGVPVSDVDLYTSTLDIPYYLSDTSPLSGAADNVLNTSMKGADGNMLSLLNGKNAVPEKTLSIPLLVSVPKGTPPAGGWPVTIFQHGITRDRTDMLALANTLAGVGRAIVAIDMPLHGVTDTTSPFKTANEMTFDLDLVTQDATTGAITAAVPDGVIDTSGRHFINLSSLATSRDNIRQAVIDLMVLKNAIASMDVDGDATADLNSDEVTFLGHSLGAMVGTVFLALDTDVQESVLAMPGGGIAKLLENSPSFGPEIVAGLAANGVSQGTADFEQFMLAAQTVLDTVDPINYGISAASNHDILLFEVVGNGSERLSDQTIPNGVATAPLSGTEPLINVMGLTQIDQNSSTTSGDVVVKYTAGHHGSILTPDDANGNEDAFSAATTGEMHTSAASYIATGSAAVGGVSSDVIAPAP